MTTSDSLFERSKKVSPGGVHSPVRAFKGVGGTPRFMTGGAGALIRDVDGLELVDFCMAFGAADPGPWQQGRARCSRGRDRSRLEPRHSRALLAGTGRVHHRAHSLGGKHPLRELRHRGRDVGVARGAWCHQARHRPEVRRLLPRPYRCHADPLGLGLAEATEPDSAGLDKHTLGGTLVAPLDDEAALEAIFSRHGNEIACAIIEPLPANYGLLPQRLEFLKTLAALCRKHGALLLLDEVISGFRLGFTGAAGLYGIEPDLVTYGKVIGGGFPVGAYGGRRQYMELVAPVGPVYQAGTLSANPVAMAAGLATLEQLADGKVYAQLEKLGAELEAKLNAIAGLTVQRVGSLFWPFLAQNAAPVRSLADLKAKAAAPFGPVFHRILDAGIYLAPSAFEVGFLSAAHDSGHVEKLSREFRAALA